MGRSAENIEKRRKQTAKKHWKKERKKTNNTSKIKITTIYIFGFKLYFARKHSLKKFAYNIKFYLQLSCAARYLKYSNDAPKLNIHKYSNYNRIIRKQIKYYNADFHSDELLDTDVIEAPSF